MCNWVPGRLCGHNERWTAWGRFVVCVIALTPAADAFGQNARTIWSHAATAPGYIVDGLPLSGRVDFESPANRGYQCSQSELFPDLKRCERTQRQLDWGARRTFDVTNSILRDSEGKAVYINRHVAPWTFDRNEIQAEFKAISSKLGEPAREMRLPPHDGLQTAVIAVWGKIELTQLDADATAILAAGESPRKGLLIDYLGNLRRSAQVGLPVYIINGGAGYLWAASVDRYNRGHIRVLAVDPAALSAGTVLATAASAAPEAEPPVGEAPQVNETAAAEKASADTEPVLAETEKTSTKTEVAQAEIAEAAVPEPDKVAPLLARLEAAETKGRLMERLVYWTLGGLILVLIIAASLLLRMRKKANAAKAQISASETQPESPGQGGLTNQAECPRLPPEILAEQDMAASDPVSQAEAAADSTRKQKQEEIKNESRSPKQGAQVVAVNGTKCIGAQPPAADVIACAHCSGEILTTDKFCMHCGASVARENERTRPCSSCRQEIGTSDKFCRYCGASSLAVAAPSMTLDIGASPDLGSARDDHKVNEVVPSTRTPVKKKRGQR